MLYVTHRRYPSRRKACFSFPDSEFILPKSKIVLSYLVFQILMLMYRLTPIPRTAMVEKKTMLARYSMCPLTRRPGVPLN